ncbi:putative bifunctional diguanylate cyclase/phosphodiesterase [Roseospira goensis]|uniref:Diguanylate cyclase (GGDEF)-like protein n=1 Tax=Roseospira goensis TaxID=391922 RepID=A0A7W6S1J3_9PROT|nr:EAL domain-containing protein [Roseospira goensis]MBB4287021.1 diguanylate cyclase (GGDEF)-like protein [Roseospira goensis]
MRRVPEGRSAGPGAAASADLAEGAGRVSGWSVRTKVLVVSALLLIALVGLAELVLLRLVGPEFADLETARAESHATRMAKTVTTELAALEGLTADWAQWDDTYDFMVTRDPDYVSTNLIEGTLESLRLTMMLIVDTDGRIAWAGQRLPDRPGLAVEAILEQDGPDLPRLMALSQDGTTGVTGLIGTARGPMLVAAQPVLTSREGGPSRGLFLMGRLVSGDVLAQYGDMLGLTIRTWSAMDPALPPGARAALETPGQPAIASIPADRAALGAYVALNDLFGEPLLVLGTRIVTTIWAQGQAVLYTAALTTAIAGAALIVLILTSLEYMVLRPLARLSAHMRDIAESGNLSAALDLERRDELGALVGAFRRMQERVAQLAYFDTVTGLPNRRLFEDRAEQILRYARRTGQRVGILFLDLDGFKLINDTRGHAAGDVLLRAVAHELHGLVRESDTIARFGGDEFVIALQDLETVEQARELAHRILARFAHPFRIGTATVFSGTSIGIAMFPDDGETVEDLVRAADAAMYQAKSAGGHSATFLDRGRHAETETLVDLGQAFRQALRTGQLFLVYQPQVDLGGGGVIGYEALVRWRHPTRGLLPAGSFIHQAYRGGLYVELDAWVLRTACAALAGRGGETAPPAPITRLSVNICARHIERPGLADLVERTLRETGVSPHRLVLEITESVLVNRPEEARTAVAALRALGVRIAVDDFGIGAASLSALHRCRADILKIDRTLVDGLPGDPTAAAISRSIITLARTLGLQVIAEGIETEDQRAFLVAAGCPVGQGHLLDG